MNCHNKLCRTIKHRFFGARRGYQCSWMSDKDRRKVTAADWGKMTNEEKFRYMWPNMNNEQRRRAFVNVEFDNPVGLDDLKAEMNEDHRTQKGKDVSMQADKILDRLLETWSDSVWMDRAGGVHVSTAWRRDAHMVIVRELLEEVKNDGLKN